MTVPRLATGVSRRIAVLAKAADKNDQVQNSSGVLRPHISSTCQSYACHEQAAQLRIQLMPLTNLQCTAMNPPITEHHDWAYDKCHRVQYSSGWGTACMPERLHTADEATHDA